MKNFLIAAMVVSGASICLAQHLPSEAAKSYQYSLTLPVEWSDYPGPLFVLENAALLGLSGEQEAMTKKLYNEMMESVELLAQRFNEAELALLGILARREVHQDAVTHAVNIAALAKAELLDAHLRFHKNVMEQLSPEQMVIYRQLRAN